MKTKIFFLTIPILIIAGLLIGFNVSAQDENITAEDLEISEPKTLPNNPFYFLKDFWRQVRLTFAFSAVKKAELRLQFANEMLIEAKRMAEETNNQELFQRAIDKYQRQMDKLQTQAEKVAEKAKKDDEKADAFLNRFERKIELHQKVLNRLEENLSENPKALERTKNAKQRTIEHLNNMKEKLIERFRNRQPACEDLCGDGICQEIVCMAIGCPCAETPVTCPQDCE